VRYMRSYFIHDKKQMAGMSVRGGRFYNREEGR
jgi:hypothetical protein